MRYISPKDQAELDATETREWLESLDYVLQSGGPAKVARLLRELTIHARQNGVKLPFTANTPYINTIPADDQVPNPAATQMINPARTGAPPVIAIAPSTPESPTIEPTERSIPPETITMVIPIAIIVITAV